MRKKRVVILGAGISGLAAAHFLQGKAEVVVLEKNSSAGGVMQAQESRGFFFECGPHTFRTKNSPHMLALSQELGLGKEIIASSPRAKKRYVLYQNRLEEVPSSLLKFLFSPLAAGHRLRTLSEWQKPPCQEDETIYDFAARRFGGLAAERFFDPLALGIFGCDARGLSMRNCFPKVKEWECRYGSVTQGMMRALFRAKKTLHPTFKHLQKAPLFSFRKGTRTLTQALEERLQGGIHFNEEVTALQKKESWIVTTTKGEYVADSVVSALPSNEIGGLLETLTPEISSLLQSLPMTALTGVHLGYTGSILPLSGFGFLVPTREKEKIMGVVFDSEIFPQHNKGEQTRLSLILGGIYPAEEATQIARRTLQRYLGIHVAPDSVHTWQNSAAIPVMQIGHEKKIASIQQALLRDLPHLHVLGNYLGFPSVEECVHRAKDAMLSIEEGMSIPS